MLSHDPEAADVDELVEASVEFGLLLRQREGLSEAAWRRLEAALQRCAEAWRDLDAIPRVAVNVMVDLFPTTEASADLYAEPERSRIMDVAYEVQDLVRHCAAVEPE